MSSEKFVRWQEKSAEALSATHGLLLALAVALIAFAVNMLLERKLDGPCAPHLALLALVPIAASVVLAVLCALNRIADFRLTASIARRAEKGSTDSDLEEDRESASRLGERTWRLFSWQLGLLAVGGAVLALSLAFQLVHLCPAL